MAEARGLAERGYTEIQLLGQNVNSYRDPSPAGWDFATLLARVAEVPGIRRVRYTTSHPRDFVKSIVDAMDANPVLCDHVHLPVQSGSSRVLAAMDRLYTRDEYMRAHRVAEERAAARTPSPPTSSSASPARRRRISSRRSTCWTRCSTIRCSASSTRRGPTPPRSNWTTAFPKRRRRGGWRSCRKSSAPSRSAATPRLIGEVREVLVEGRNQALGPVDRPHLATTAR